MKKAELESQALPRYCNEALILGVLSSGPKHGYQMALEIEERSGGFFGFQHGTLYPILHKLEKEGLIRGKWKKGRTGRKKKLYSLTGKGERTLNWHRKAWDTFFKRLFAMIGEDQK